MTFWYWMGHTLSRIIAKIFLSYRVYNQEALTSVEGGMLIASNHVSFLDPPLVGIAYRYPVHYFARKTLFDHPMANYILHRTNAIPVDQEKPELSILRKVIQLLKDDEKVVIFPEGERSFDGVMNPAGQPGIGMIVSKARVPVLPVRLFGPEKALPRGIKRLKRQPCAMVVGEPVDYTELIEDKSLSTKERYQKIAAHIMQEIAKLEMPDEEKLRQDDWDKRKGIKKTE